MELSVCKDKIIFLFHIFPPEIRKNGKLKFLIKEIVEDTMIYKKMHRILQLTFQLFKKKERISISHFLKFARCILRDRKFFSTHFLISSKVASLA